MRYDIEIYRDFYLNEKPGPHGLTFKDSTYYKQMDELGRHDYFQWLFPTNVESSYNKAAPFLDEELIKFLTSIENKLTEASKKYIEYIKSIKEWPSPTDHNNLRLSRILRCFNLLNLTNEADHIYSFLLDTHSKDQSLTLNNMDHFRSAMFDKTFFVVYDYKKDFTNTICFLRKTLPDHKLLRIELDDVTDFTRLCEPVLFLCKSPRINYDLRPELLKRGKLFKVNPTDDEFLEKYFLTFRFWY